MSPLQLFADCPVTVLLLRHAERASSPVTDPPLTSAGQERAHALIQVAGKAGVRAVFTTQFVRSKQTAQPLANHLGITPIVLSLSATSPQAYVQELVARIRSTPANTSVLVVSHTNTIPMIVAELSGLSIAPIGQEEFDRLFIIETRRLVSRSRVVMARYGAP